MLWSCCARPSMILATFHITPINTLCPRKQPPHWQVPPHCASALSLLPHTYPLHFYSIFVARLTCSKRVTPKPTESEYRGALKNCEHPRAQLVLRGPHT